MNATTKYSRQWQMMIFRILFSLAILTVNLGKASASSLISMENAAKPQQMIDASNPVFTADCYENVLEADANDDMLMDREEYVTFAQLSSPPGLLDNVQNFDNLPFAFKVVFTTLACLCSDPAYGGDPNDTECCIGPDPAIRVTAPPGLQQSEEDRRMLYATCALTDLAAEDVMNSPAPSAEPVPTLPPTPPPTTIPTQTPSNAPSSIPSAPPSGTPTSGPSAFPSATPTFKPSASPSTTTSPTRNPSSTDPPTISIAPTSMPSVGVTTAPAAPPPGTPGPTVVPATVAPTTTPEIWDARVNYNVILLDAAVSPDLADYYSNLSIALLFLSQDVAEGFILSKRRSLTSSSLSDAHEWTLRDLPEDHRHLQDLTVRVVPPTFIDNATTLECNPLLATGENDVCQTIFSRVVLAIRNAEDPGAVRDQYQSDLFNAIYDQGLQPYLTDLGARVVVTTGQVPSPPNATMPPLDVGDGLTSGAIAGICLAGVFIIIIPLICLLIQRTNEHHAKKESLVAEVDEKDNAGAAVAGRTAAAAERGLLGPMDEPPSVDTDMYTDAAASDAATGGAVMFGAAATATAASRSTSTSSSSVKNRNATLGAAPPDYGKKSSAARSAGVGAAGILRNSSSEYNKSVASRKALEAMEAGEDIVADTGMDRDSSSNAGSSGWSSGDGFSSNYTGSVDDSMDAALNLAGSTAGTAGTTLAAIGVSSALSRKLESERQQGEEGVVGIAQDADREQLDTLIEAGDWAAVGATAALLAAASDSASASTRSRSRSSRRSRSTTSNSVDAARAAELDHLVDAGDWEGVVLAAAKFEADEAAAMDSRGSRTGSSVDSSASGTDGGATGSSPSETASGSDDPSKAKKRAEMREEVEALVRRVVPEEIDNVDEMMNQFKGREEELVETLRTMQERAVAQKARTAGHRAAKVEARRSVQRGVVPGTAGVQSTTLGVGDSPIVGARAESLGTGTAGMAAPAAPQNARSALEMAIEAGDWEAVGEAAAMMSDGSIGTKSSSDVFQFSSDDRSTSTDNAGRSRRSLEGINATRATELDSMIDQGDWTGVVAAANRFSQMDKNTAPKADVKRSKEEEEALAQAELWTKIAEQKKAEGATDAGASDAAEWAIQRSLSQLKQADKQREGEQKKGDEYEDEV